MEEVYLQTIESYNKSAEEYIKNVKGLMPMNEFEKLVKYVKAGRILDVGCGSGVGCRNLQERGFEAHGIDLCEKLLEASKIESPNSLFYKMDMMKLTFPNEFFDGIWYVASLLHLKKSDAPIALHEANRVLKKNGVMYLAIKEGEDEGLEEDKRYGGLLKYYAYYKQKEIENVLKNENFEILENYVVEFNDSYRIAHPWMNVFARKL
jgi:ubiquinone/menaquinone biosynthesis C-methylase UbiE